MIDHKLTGREDMFCKTLPNMQKVWDSTSLGYLLECKRKYYQSLVLGYRKSPQPPPLWYGTMIHRGIEIYLKERAKGNKNYLRKAIRKVLADSFGYYSDDNRRTKMTLVRALVWYDHHFQDDPLKVITLSNGKVAAELSFRISLPIISPDGDNYILAGHMDAVVEFAKQLWVLEHKHTVMALNDKYFAQFTPNNQVSLYSLAGKTILKEPIQGVIINGIQVGAGFARFQRKPIPRSIAFLDEWLNDVCYEIKMTEQYAKADRWPGNDTACSKYSGCVFRESCGKAPRMRERWLESHFKREFWNPLDNRD